MKRFDYRLQAVHDWRRIEAEKQQAKLHTLIAERLAIDRDLSILEEERSALASEIASSKTLEPSTLHLTSQFQDYARRRRAHLEQLRREAEARIRLQREQVMEAQRRFELLEKLKAKQAAAWTQQAAREEESRASELFLAQQSRRFAGPID